VNESTEVLITGAGPAGLLLACELRLAGVAVVVIERSPRRPDFCRGFNLNPRALDLLARRGLADALISEGWRVPQAAFSGLPVTLGLAAASTDHPYSLGIPQTRVEEVLEARARDLGADLRRGHRLVTLIQQDPESVTRPDSPADTRDRADPPPQPTPSPQPTPAPQPTPPPKPTPSATRSPTGTAQPPQAPHEPPAPGQTWVSSQHPAARARRSGAIVGLFRRTKRSDRATRKPTLRERRAAERTARAETALEQTEQRIHQLADQVRDDLRTPKR
jgi:hypothetical protein